MKKSTFLLLLLTGIPTLILLIVLWLGGTLEKIYLDIGIIGIIGVLLFIAFTLFIVYFGQRLARKAIQPKTLTNGIPAIATVVRSYQGNLSISMGGVNQNYQLIIEINLTNPQKETWSATMKEMINITQIGLFQPGVKFKVLYDPNDKSKVVFDQS